MISMISFENEEMKEQLDRDLYHLSNEFGSLNIGHKKGVLKTAQGLLRIQRAQKIVRENDAGK